MWSILSAICVGGTNRLWNARLGDSTERLGRLLLLLIFAGVLGGCGGPAGPTVVPVRGTVQYKGKPLTGGTILFSPSTKDEGRVAEAKIAADGSFKPSTMQTGDGLVAGTYAISINSTIKGTEPLPKDAGTGIGGESAIPTKYLDPQTSGLKETITEQDAGKVLDIDLKDP